MKIKEQIPYWLITIGTIIALILPRLAQDGMFTDGVLYAAVAHNLAIGKGTIWFPYFDNFLFPFFHQQPPLTFIIQSYFFENYGDSMYVERVYSFGTACISAGLIAWLWMLINKDDPENKKMAWLPVLMWIIIPVCFWAYSNNMEENTMGVFTLLAVVLIYKGLMSGNWFKVAYIIVGSAVTMLAFLCKGFPGLFPVIIPALYYVVIRPARYPSFRAVVFSILAIVVPFVIFNIIMVHNYINRSLTAYLNERVLNSIQHVSNVNSRFYIIGNLFFVQLIVPVLLTAIILGISGRAAFRFKELNNEYKKKILLFLLIGACASFPLIVTKEQRNFYLVTSLPYYAIALALLACRHLNVLLLKIKPMAVKVILAASALYVIIGLLYSYSLMGKIGRDKEQLHDVYAFGKIIHNDADVKVYRETYQDWGLHNYFVRYFCISLSRDTSNSYEYFLLEKSLNKPPPPVYNKLVAQGEKYDLYKK